ncbi:MAG: glutathione S-transferase family protein [Xenococcaceae cyanobacterium MO_234.B1]|nr:glutathione S-transferase family protein [Xenococcaceae cyanobacterium MO_234.B1]
MKIYGDIQSGNCYKVKLVCALLDINHDWIAIDILAGDTKKPEFLTKNPNGKIPLLELSDGRYLWESNAILNFLAAGSQLLPKNDFDLAKVQQWQFFEQYSHEPYIAVARFIAKYLGLPVERRAEYESKQAGGYKALNVMEEQLKKSRYLTGDNLTTADISLYGYTHVAEEGGFDLTKYPAIQLWIDRIASEPKYVGMD